MNRSVKIAAAILVLLSLYMLTGLVRCGGNQEDTAAAETTSTAPKITVLARDVVAEPFIRKVRITAKTRPSRSVELKAETAGKISGIGKARGTFLEGGDEIAMIEVNDRLARLEQAKAALEQAQFEFDAAERLEERDLRSASQVAQSLSALRGAEQRVRAMELDIEFTRIKAPFAGVLQERYVEIGDYLGVGDPVARVIDMDPIVVEGHVTEEEVSDLRIGELGHARLPDGRLVDGLIRYVASEADPDARTFQVELEVPNPDRSIPAGLTASIEVETQTVQAIRVTKDLLAVTDEGRVGIKVVDEDNRVRFIEADKRELGPESIWITGIPDKIRLIVRGQGYTREGDVVGVSLETGAE